MSTSPQRFLPKSSSPISCHFHYHHGTDWNCVTNCFPARASWDAEEHYMMDRYEVSSYHNWARRIPTFNFDAARRYSDPEISSSRSLNRRCLTLHVPSSHADLPTGTFYPVRRKPSTMKGPINHYPYPERCSAFGRLFQFDDMVSHIQLGAELLHGWAVFQSVSPPFQQFQWLDTTRFHQ